MKYELHSGGHWAQKLIHLIKEFDGEKILKESYKESPCKGKEDIDSDFPFNSKQARNTTAAPQKVTVNAGHIKAFCEKQTKDLLVASIWWLHTFVSSAELPPLPTVKKETVEAL